MREIVELVEGGWVAEDGDVNVILEAAIDLEGPAGEGAAEIRAELLSTGEEDTDFER